MDEKRRVPNRAKWTAVRVSKDTKARLDKLRDLWTEQAHKLRDQLGQQSVRSGAASTRDEVGLDQVIRRLIRLWEQHAKRSNPGSQFFDFHDGAGGAADGSLSR